MQKQKLKTCVLGIIILLISLGVGLLIRQDMHFEALRVQSEVAEVYQYFAGFISEDGYFSYFDSNARAADHNFLGHPPGYSFFLAFILHFLGESNFTTQIITILIGGFSAVIVFLIGQKLISTQTGFLAGVIAAFCPQFAFNSVLLLPDTMAIFPILLAVYFWVRSFQKPRLITIILAAICLAVSCWFRANALFLPIFFVISVPLLFEKGQRLKYAVTFLFIFILIILPITMRNAVIYGEFIPISLGAGQTLLEGISDYDTGKRFGIPSTDMEIMRSEAEKYQNPDYKLSLFGKDGIKREQWRINQGWQIIKENPFWFAGVMVRRAVSMLKLERVRTVSTAIPVTRRLSEEVKQNIEWKALPTDLETKGVRFSTNVQTSLIQNKLILLTDNSKNNAQFGTAPILVEKYKEYIAEVELRLIEGRISVKAQGTESKAVYGFVIVDLLEGKIPQPERTIQIPFVTDRNEPIQLVIYNEPNVNSGSLIELKELKLYNLGSSPNGWTKFFRLIINIIQKLYITAILLPLLLIGLLVLIKEKNFKVIVILGIIPLYYFCVQSALHTEYRYVMALHYFTFIIAAFCLTTAGEYLIRQIKQLSKKNE